MTISKVKIFLMFLFYFELQLFCPSFCVLDEIPVLHIPMQTVHVKMVLTGGNLLDLHVIFIVNSEHKRWNQKI